MVAVWGGLSGRDMQRKPEGGKPPSTPPCPQLLEFDSTKVSEGASQPSGKPYPPYSLAEFSWNNITNSLDLATLSAIFQGHPVDESTGAFANGSLAFKVRLWVRNSKS